MTEIGAIQLNSFDNAGLLQRAATNRKKQMTQIGFREWSNRRYCALGWSIGLLLHAMPAGAAAEPAPESRNAPAKPGTGAAPAFDMAAARASARAMARDDRQRPAALVLRQEATGALTTDQIQQRFEQARRGNCLKANDSMNLLANVVMLARDIVATSVDDSGCKW